MGHVDQFVAAIAEIAGITEDGFASPQDIAVVLRDARARIIDSTDDQSIKWLVLVEIDKALAAIEGNNRPGCS